MHYIKHTRSTIAYKYSTEYIHVSGNFGHKLHVNNILISFAGKAVVESTTPYLSYVGENVVDGDTDSYSSGFCSHSVCKRVFHY